jgi:hypothetical protein
MDNKKQTQEGPAYEPHKWMQKMAHEEFVDLLREQARDTCGREPGSAKWMLEAARRLDDLAGRMDDCTGARRG